MRNLLQYPITTEEIVRELERLRREQIETDESSGVVGCIRAAVLAEAIERVHRLDDLMK